MGLCGILLGGFIFVGLVGIVWPWFNMKLRDLMLSG